MTNTNPPLFLFKHCYSGYIGELDLELELAAGAAECHRDVTGLFRIKHCYSRYITVTSTSWGWSWSLEKERWSR